MSNIVEVSPCPLEESESVGYDSKNQSALNVASQDKFLVVLSLPPILKGVNYPFKRTEGTVDRDTVVYKVYGIKIPAVKVPSQKIPYGGYSAKISSHAKPEYESVPVSFSVDSGFQNYHVLYKWLDVLAGDMGNNFDSKNIKSSSSGKLEEYTTTITVFALDEYDRAVAEFVFYGAFLTELNGIDYNYRQEKEIESSFIFDFTFMKMNLIEEPITIHF